MFLQLVLNQISKEIMKMVCFKSIHNEKQKMYQIPF